MVEPPYLMSEAYACTVDTSAVMLQKTQTPAQSSRSNWVDPPQLSRATNSALFREAAWEIPACTLAGEVCCGEHAVGAENDRI